MGSRLNDKSMIINEVSHKRNINDKSMMVSKTEYIAGKLEKIYSAPQSRNFFLKCAWHLSEDTIWSAVENSRKNGIKNPTAYFVACCNKALRERPMR